MNLLRVLRSSATSSGDFVSPSNPLPVYNTSSATATPFAYETPNTSPMTQVVRSSPGAATLTASNPTATPVYLKVYDKATTPNPASDTPIRTVKISADTDVNIYLSPKRFAAGFAFAITGAAAKNDTTAIVAGVQVSGDQGV